MSVSLSAFVFSKHFPQGNCRLDAIFLPLVVKVIDPGTKIIPGSRFTAKKEYTYFKVTRKGGVRESISELLGSSNLLTFVNQKKFILILEIKLPTLLLPGKCLSH